MIGSRTIDRIVQISAPIVATTLLAALVLVAVPPKAPTGAPSGPVGVDPGRVVALTDLPNADYDQIVNLAERGTEERASCTGPWVSAKILNWACRTPDTLVILRGRSRSAIEELDMTWFGFDPSRSDLAAWATAASRLEERELIAGWVRASAGSQATTTIGSIKLIAGGSRGAISLIVAGLPCQPRPVPSGGDVSC